MDEYIRREDVLKGKKTGTFANGICLVAEPCVTVKYIESIEPADVVQVCRCKDCIHNNDCDIQYSAQAGDNFFCGFGETEKDVREDVYE